MRHTEEMHVTLKTGRKVQTYTLPLALERTLKDFISLQLQEADLEKSVPASQVFPELLDPVQRPALMLRGSRHKAEMTQQELAAALEIRQHHLSEMENGKRPIGKKMAHRLADVLDCDYRVFI